MKDSIKQAKIIIDSISAMIQSSLSKAKFNTKKRATIQALNGDGTANITMNGITYNNVKIRTGLLPQVNEVVWIEIPNNNFNDAFIDSANQVAGTGETVDPNSHTHTNKALLDTYTQTEVNLADAVSKKHEHNNLTLLQTITQSLIDTWNTVSNKVDKVTGKQLSTEDYTTTEKSKLAGITDIVQSVGGKTGIVTLAKSDVGLSSVDNTSDINKPISTATQTALNNKSATTHNHSLTNLTEKNYSSLSGKPLDDNFHNLTELLSSINTDEILIYDSTNLTYKKMTKQNLLSGISGSDYVVVQYEEEFIATEGQIVFNLTKGTYDVGVNRLQLFIIGVRQPNTSFIETSSTSITLKNGLSAGDPVLVSYISVMDVMNFIHAENHKIGGIDPISPDSIGASEVSHTHASSSVTDLAESVQDIVGEMISTNTEKGIAVTYDDTNGKINFDVNDPTITLTGNVSGFATMTNLGNVSITTTIVDDSHNHIIENIDGLQTMLNTKAPSVSPNLTGIPTAPTATAGTNTTQLATTAFVKNTLTALGAGDMKRSIYDTNLNGKVDGAESADTAASLTGLTSTIAELNYVDGVTSAIQTQLDGKSPTSHASTATTYGAASTSNYGHVKVSTGINVSTGSISVKYGTASGTACQGNDNRLSDGKVIIGITQPANQTCLWIDTN